MSSRVAVATLVACLTILACEDDDDTGSGLSARDVGANLSGASVRPTPVATTATGTSSLHVTSGTSDVYDPDSDHLANYTYSITVNGLSGPATNVHIHGPGGVDDVAPVLASLQVTSQGTSGIVSNGSFIGTENPQVSGDSLLVLLMAGNAYVDVHTTANPDGEIRGQSFLVNAFRVASSVRR